VLTRSGDGAGPTGACQQAAHLLDSMGGVAVAMGLRAGESLHCYTVDGMWRVHDLPPGGAGPIRVALASGRVSVDDPGAWSDSPYPLNPLTQAVLCVPIPGHDKQPLGVVQVELFDRTALSRIRTATEQIAATLSHRLDSVQYASDETPTERLVRHAFRIALSEDEDALAAEIFQTAREVSGLDTAVALTREPSATVVVTTDPECPTDLARRLAELDVECLDRIFETGDQYGTWYVAGPPNDDTEGAVRALLDIGVGTVVAIPAYRDLEPRRDGVQKQLLLVDERVCPPTPATVDLLHLLKAQSHMSYRRIELIDLVRERSRQDPLTGLGNRRTFSERIESTTPGHTALIAIDVDNFKAINDNRGHEAGDEVLIEVSKALSAVLRADDQLFRTGGDEFVAVVDLESPDQAARVGGRMLRAARATGCTISVGVCVQAPGEDAAQALRRADAALCEAKRRGRDQLRLCS
jgi:diguanylate cyclase (GGDEF)-like protein